MPNLIIYQIVQEKQPEVIEELRRRRLLRWWPGGETEPVVAIDGHPYRDVTETVIATTVGVGVPPGHDAYRRIRGRLRQVKWG